MIALSVVAAPVGAKEQACAGVAKKCKKSKKKCKKKSPVTQPQSPAPTPSPAPDQGPVAADDAASLAEDAGPTAINVLANDTDPDGGPKSVTSGDRWLRWGRCGHGRR